MPKVGRSQTLWDSQPLLQSPPDAAVCRHFASTILHQSLQETLGTSEHHGWLRPSENHWNPSESFRKLSEPLRPKHHHRINSEWTPVLSEQLWRSTLYAYKALPLTDQVTPPYSQQAATLLPKPFPHSKSFSGTENSYAEGCKGSRNPDRGRSCNTFSCSESSNQATSWPTARSELQQRSFQRT